MTLPQIQIMLALLSAGAMLSAAWLVLHARDVALLLRPVTALVPGAGQRLASFRAVSAGLTVFAFSIAGLALVVVRAIGA